MEQGTLWDLNPRVDSGVAPIWGRLDATSRTEVRTKLSVPLDGQSDPPPTRLTAQRKGERS